MGAFIVASVGGGLGQSVSEPGVDSIAHVDVLDWLRDQMNDSTKVVQTIFVITTLLLVRWLVLRALRGRFENSASYFRTRKWMAYGAFGIGAYSVFTIWTDRAGSLGTYLGILSAGIAIALADVLENLAGWAFIVVRRPFKVGDRIEVEGRAGDVVDIRVFRFTMLEIGAWVDADQSTGRLIHVPNGRVFSEQITNFTEGFPYIWDEIGVMVTFESDWKRTEEIVRQAMSEHAPDTSDGTIARAIRQAAHHYLIRYTHLTPNTYISVKDSGVMIYGRYLVPARQRRYVTDQLWRAILDAFAAEPTVDLAYPTIRNVIQDPLRWEGDRRDPD
jgi:small-conductance mechanosensitive channel